MPARRAGRQSVNGGRLAHLHDPKERLEYLRAKAIGRLLESAAAVFLENEDAILSGASLTTNCLRNRRSGCPCRPCLKVAKETIYTGTAGAGDRNRRFRGARRLARLV